MSTEKPTPDSQPERFRSDVSPGNVRCAVDLRGDVATTLRSAGEISGADWPQILTAAVALYLHRFSSACDLTLVATLTPERAAETSAPVVPTTLALALGVAVAPQETFSKLIHKVIVAWRNAESAQAAPPGSRRPVRTSIHSIPVTVDSPLTGSATSSGPLEIGQVEDLTIHFHDPADDAPFTIELEARSDLYTPDALAAHLRRFITLLGQLTAAALEKPVNRFNIVDADERRKLFAEFNTAAQPIPDTTLPMLFEAQVARTPDALAVVFGDEACSYRELNIRANRLARHLRAEGVGPDVPVSICLDRSIEMMVAVLAILKAGGAYLPLDPTLPEPRLALLLKDSDCPLVITTSPHVAMLRRCSGTASRPPLLVAMDAVELPAGAPAQANLGALNTPDQLAYILFTSGSTGHPKGVEMPHRALVNLIHWQCAASAMTNGDRTLQFAHLGFDVSFQEMFATWASGGTLVLVADHTRKDPAALFAELVRQKINRLFLPFIVLERLAEVGQQATSPLPALREVFVAGEQLRISPVIRRFFERLPGCRLGNHYGPTEAHVVTAFDLSGPPSAWPDLPSIGRPLPNCEIHLLDAAAELVPVGGTGELCIGGVCLARGYRQRPDLTAERFVAHPFDRRPEARLYKTGDLARWHADGTIEFLGRADFQIKIRGFRIEPGEIEAALTEQPEIAQAAVIARDDAQLGRHLVAYLVPAPNRAVDPTRARCEIVRRLPSYMVPSAFVVIDALPLTPNGKIDRRALPAPQPCHHETGDASVIPLDPLEHQVATIWKQIFGRPGLGVRDNFFELGGHSLLAVQLVNELNRRLRSNLSTLELFQNPTVEELARLLSAKTQVEREPRLIQLRPGPDSPALIFIYQEGGISKFQLARLLKREMLTLATVVPVADSVLKASASNQPGGRPSLEELAAAHVQLIQEHQPFGSCLLAGHSFNGLLAFEIAQQLSRLGRKIEAVLLLDAEVGARPFGWWFRIRLPFHINNARKKGLAYLFRKVQARLGWIRRTAPPVRPPESEPIPRFDPARAAEWNRLEKIYEPASRHYQPQPIACRGMLFRVRETLSGFLVNDRSLGWNGKFKEGLEIIDLPGDHFSMLDEPHVQTLADRFNAAIDTVVAKPASAKNSLRQAAEKLALVGSIKMLEYSELFELEDFIPFA